jgi:hypothetical protein
MNLMIEILGWIGSLLVVGAYFMNFQGKLSVTSPVYVYANLIGALLLIVLTWHHRAFPSMAVNIVWVAVAIYAMFRKPK